MILSARLSQYCGIKILDLIWLPVYKLYVFGLFLSLIMITSQGRGGLDLAFMGSVAQQVVQLTDSPVFILPIFKELAE